MRTAVTYVSILLAGAIGLSDGCAEAKAQTRNRKARPATGAEFKTGKSFREALGETISATWQASEVGEASQIHVILGDLSRRFQIAILLDRRIDPHQHLTLEVSKTPLRDVLEQIAGTLSTDASPLGLSVLTNAVYIGPKPAAERLRTLIELRSRELEAIREPRSGAAIASRSSRSWDELSSPRELLQEWTGRYRITIENLDVVEHDLWRAGELPQSTLVEACSVVLNQFDLTFEWKHDRSRLSLVLVPVPEKVFVKSTVPLNSLKARGESLDDIRRLVEGAGLDDPPHVANIDGEGVTVEGRVEAVEELIATLSGGSSRKKSRTPPKNSLSRKVFTLTVRGAPLSAILEKLVADGIPIEYNAETFAAAGIDLSRKVTISVENVSTEELFEALFKSQPVEVEVTNDGVVLTVRRLPPSRE